jgi:hypothetical protein
LEARGSPRRWCHGPTGVGLRIGSRNWGSPGVVVFAGDRVIDEPTGIALVEFGAEVLVVGGLTAGLALIEVLLVEGANSIGTLLGVVGGILWW